MYNYLTTAGVVVGKPTLLSTLLSATVFFLPNALVRYPTLSTVRGGVSPRKYSVFSTNTHIHTPNSNNKYFIYI